MADDRTQAELAQLRAEFAAFRARLPARERRWRTPRRLRLLPLALVALLVALAPLTSLAALFTDLNSGSPHNGNIVAIADAGITRGCNPPLNDQYCPNDLVTREQMASFLARTAGLGGNPPVANAKTAETATEAGHAASAANAVHATTAGNATTVGGIAPNGLVRVAFLDKTIGIPALTASEQVLATVTIVAPAAGFVFVTMTASELASCSPACVTYVYLRDQAGTGPGYAAAVIAPPTSAPSAPSASQSYVFPVAAGSRSFSVRGSVADAGSAYVPLKQILLTAIFIPFGYDGGTTLQP